MRPLQQRLVLFLPPQSADSRPGVIGRTAASAVLTRSLWFGPNRTFGPSGTWVRLVGSCEMLEEADTYERRDRTLVMCSGPEGGSSMHRETLLLNTLKELHRDANKSELFDMTLDCLLERIREITDCQEVQIASVSASASTGPRVVVFAATPGLRSGAAKAFASGKSQQTDDLELSTQYLDLNSLAGAVVRIGGVVASEDVAKDPRADACDRDLLGSTNFLGLPLMGTNGLVGVLSLAHFPMGTADTTAELLEPLCLTLGSLLDRQQARLLSDQLRAECSQAHSEFVALSQTVEAPVLMSDNEGVVWFMNSFAEQTFGVSSADLGPSCVLNRLLGSAFQDFGDPLAERHGLVVPLARHVEREWTLALPTETGGVSLRMKSSVLRDRFGNQNGVLHVGTLAPDADAANRRNRQMEQVQDQLDEMTLRESELRLLTEMFSYVMVADTVRAALKVVATYSPRLLRDPSLVLHRVGGESSRTSSDAHADDLGRAVTATDCWAVRTGRLHLNLPERAARCSHAGPSGASLCAPLQDGEKVLAVLTIDVSSESPDRLPKRMSFVDGVIFQMNLALNNLRLRRSLSDQALTDPLTSVGNRRRAAEAVDAAYDACLVNNEPFALLMADIDFFKQVNDTYGHDVGDQVLKHVASTLLASVRESDAVARVGGEEFLIVLRNISAVDAERVAEQIRSGVEACEGEGLPRCTISIGLLHLVACVTDVESLTPLVDSALYKAKSSGRNQVSVVQNSAIPRLLATAATDRADSTESARINEGSVPQ